MSRAVSPKPATVMAEDVRLELAILDLLKTRREVYPTHLIDALRERDAGLRVRGLGDVLEKLFREQRVARLWHRYMLPHDVGAVRRKWLAAIDDRIGGPETDTGDAVAIGRRLLERWDGWSHDAR
ncbi:MAG: hypothetical protein EOP67_14870 [Sphingomonas sp.]|nr:MAG: hypothetical protein EOP67_14870 [Sphingomonas sp.]